MDTQRKNNIVYRFAAQLKILLKLFDVEIENNVLSFHSKMQIPELTIVRR